MIQPTSQTLLGIFRQIYHVHIIILAYNRHSVNVEWMYFFPSTASQCKKPDLTPTLILQVLLPWQRKPTKARRLNWIIWSRFKMYLQEPDSRLESVAAQHRTYLGNCSHVWKVHETDSERESPSILRRKHNVTAEAEFGGSTKHHATSFIPVHILHSPVFSDVHWARFTVCLRGTLWGVLLQLSLE